MSLFALVDCNNFYVSCERAFAPHLETKPVVVLSNNDGCIISRSNEAKQMGIPMGAPFFKWEFFCKKNKVRVFSSNYELYGDMSRRVMQLLKSACPAIEIYSIDEAFLCFDKINAMDLQSYLSSLKNNIKQSLGLPVSIGIAPTKTLAKVANHIAKKAGVAFVYELCDQKRQSAVLSQLPVENIWGIGSQLAKRLHQLNIYTAMQLRDTEPKRIRDHFNVLIEKTVQELRGISCLPLVSLEARQQIIFSRSFGKAVTELTYLEEAISHFSAKASEKLRQEKSLTRSLCVFLEMNLFQRHRPQYQNYVFFPFPMPTADTANIIRVAKKCIRYLYRPGYRYHRAGILLPDLVTNSIQQLDMFIKNSARRQALMQTLDSINQQWRQDTIFFGAEGIKRPWKMQANKLSPRYTTRWHELLSVD